MSFVVPYINYQSIILFFFFLVRQVSFVFNTLVICILFYSYGKCYSFLRNLIEV